MDPNSRIRGLNPDQEKFEYWIWIKAKTLDPNETLVLAKKFKPNIPFVEIPMYVHM